jgi:hypothetical protein
MSRKFFELLNGNLPLAADLAGKNIFSEMRCIPMKKQ